MSDLVTSVRTERIPIDSASVWEVFCVDCNLSIGTMSGLSVTKAIMHNLQRGGVKCPDCRASSCQGCGLNLLKCDRGGLATLEIAEEYERMRLCSLCQLEMEQVIDRQANRVFVE